VVEDAQLYEKDYQIAEINHACVLCTAPLGEGLKKYERKQEVCCLILNGVVHAVGAYEGRSIEIKVTLEKSIVRSIEDIPGICLKKGN